MHDLKLAMRPREALCALVQPFSLCCAADPGGPFHPLCLPPFPFHRPRRRQTAVRACGRAVEGQRPRRPRRQQVRGGDSTGYTSADDWIGSHDSTHARGTLPQRQQQLISHHLNLTQLIAPVGAISSKFEAHIAELTQQLDNTRRIAEEGAARESELRWGQRCGRGSV
jgi:hypothetical protein